MTQPLLALGEFQLHDLIRDAVAEHQDVDGMSDDCAVLTSGTDGGPLVLLNVDRLPRCRFEVAPRLLVAQALSDVVCMGGAPFGLMPALALPRDMSVRSLRWFMNEVARESARYGACVLGGDTKEADEFGAVTCAVGFAAGPVVRRSGAQAGDAIVVTSAAATGWGERWLSYLAPDRPSAESWRRDIQLPHRETAAALATGHVTSGTDLSDGIGAGCTVLSRASGRTFVLDFAAVEGLVDESLRQEAAELGLPKGFLALSPGYMWENCFTVDETGAAAVVSAVLAARGGAAIVGRVEEGPAQVLFSGAPDSWLSLASDEKFRAVPGGSQPATWLARARTLLAAGSA